MAQPTYKRRSFRTPRLNLRPYQEGDFSTWQEALTHAKYKRRNQYDREIPEDWNPTRAEFRKIIRKHRAGERLGTHFVWPIFLKHSGQLVGVCDVLVLHRGNLQVANLGYLIDNRFWGQGYASEAIRALIHHALLNLDLNRLEAVIDIGNLRSIGLAKKLGLRREGIRRHFYFQDGAWADQVVYVADRAAFKLRPLLPKE